MVLFADVQFLFQWMNKPILQNIIYCVVLAHDFFFLNVHIKDNNEKENKTTKNLLGPGAETRGGHGWLCSTIY